MKQDDVQFLETPVSGRKVAFVRGGQRLLSSTITQVLTDPSFPGWFLIKTASGSSYSGKLADKRNTSATQVSDPVAQCEVILPCPKCGAKNRVPRGKQTFKAQCGKCKAALSASGHQQSTVTNLTAINALSDKWEDSFESEGVVDFNGRRYPNQEYHKKGEAILRMYEVEQEALPSDASVVMGLANHLFRLANAKYAHLRLGVLSPSYGYLDDLKKLEAGSATKACRYALRCYSIAPNAGAAAILVAIFRTAGFYGTAIYWCERMQEAAELKGMPDRTVEARAMTLEMRAEGHSSDPVIRQDSVFPTRNTPGLVTKNQPHSSPPTGSSNSRSTNQASRSGKCYIATACYGSCDHPDVQVLRRFRDERLLPTSLGRCLVDLYYAVSPKLAASIGRNHRLSQIIRQRVFEPLVQRLEKASRK